MKFFNRFKLDNWWVVVFGLGVLSLGAAFFISVPFLNPKNLFGLGVGLTLIGVAYLMGEVRYYKVKLPDLYPGDGGWLYAKEIKHGPAGLLLLGLGLILTGAFLYRLLKPLW